MHGDEDVGHGGIHEVSKRIGVELIGRQELARVGGSRLVVTAYIFLSFSLNEMKMGLEKEKKKKTW